MEYFAERWELVVILIGVALFSCGAMLVFAHILPEPTAATAEQMQQTCTLQGGKWFVNPVSDGHHCVRIGQ